MYQEHQSQSNNNDNINHEYRAGTSFRPISTVDTGLRRSKSSRWAAPSNNNRTNDPLSVGSSTEGTSELMLEECRRFLKHARQREHTMRHYHESTPGVDLNRYQHALLMKTPRSMKSQSANLKYNSQAGSSIKFGRALFDFAAKNGQQLSLSRGDLIKILKVPDHNWALVEDCQSGLQGLVPLSYLDYSVGCAVAKRDVHGDQRISNLGRAFEGDAMSAEHDQPDSLTDRRLLQMNKGEPITLLRRLKGHLYEGSNTRRALGLVWSTDLDIIKQPVLDARPSKESNSFNQSHDTKPTLRSNSNLQDQHPHSYYYDEDDDDDLQDEDVSQWQQEHQMLLRRPRARSASGCGRDSERSTNNNRINKQPIQIEANCLCGWDKKDVFQQDQRLHHHILHSDPYNKDSYPITDSNELEHHPHNHESHYQRPRRSSSSPFIGSAEVKQVEVAGAGPSADLGAQASDVEATAETELPRLCRAKYPYKPRQSDELELAVGDVLLIVQKCDDGWFIGSSYSTKRMGTFPGNFVETL